MNMDAPTYACDECLVPVELVNLVRFKDGHICKFCYEKHHPKLTYAEPDIFEPQTRAEAADWKRRDEEASE